MDSWTGVFYGCLFLFYFLPTIIATDRKNDQKKMIGLVNLLIGWTVIGWVACLIWAGIGQSKSEVAYYKLKT